MAARKKAAPADPAAVAEESPAPVPAPVPAAEMRLTDPLPSGRLVIEASAGTGKTYSLTALVVRHLAEGPLVPRDILVVTYTRAAAAELRDRMRRGLVEARAALHARATHAESDWLSTIVTQDDEQFRARRDRLDHAIANFDEATISTIHGFCQQALSQLGLRSGSMIDGELTGSISELVDEVCRDVLMRRLWHAPLTLSWMKSSPKEPVGPETVLGHLVEVVAARLGNPLVHTVPSDDDLDAMAAKSDVTVLREWVALVETAVEEVEHRRRIRREIGYDDLVATLHDALTDTKGGPAVAAALRDRYRLVLVDEFQDTDPLQWAIFETAFTGDLVTVGDPKQAIYRFRGADVHAYLAATATGDKRSLRTNYRSDRDLVTATNVLVEGVELGHPAIVAEAVRAAERSPARALADGAPLMLRHLRFDHSLSTSSDDTPMLSAPLARRAIVEDLVALVVEMLDGHRLHVGEPQEKRVEPGDVAVLVPTHRHADEVVRAFAAARIPAVRARTGSVFLTPAADEWRLLLAALERPSHAPTVRAAALGVFLHRSPESIDPMASLASADGDGSGTGEVDAPTAEVQRRCAEWAQQMASRPLLAWYDAVRADSGLVEHLMTRPDGERLLTDLDHIAELLATDASGAGLDATTTRRRLDHRIAAAASMGDDEVQMRRIDSDAAAVQVSTIHGSKGLQYPIVLLPFSWSVPTRIGPRIYNVRDGRRVLDVATSFNWKGVELESKLDARRHFDSLGRQGDQLRLAYVALTRAEHRTVLWVAQYKDSKTSALNVMLFDRDASGVPLRTQPTLGIGPRGGLTPSVVTAAVSDDDAAARLRTLADRSGGTLSVDECPPATPPSMWEPDIDERAQPLSLSVADPGGCAPRRPWWRRWSFSTIVDTRGDHAVRMRDHEPVIAGGADEPGADEPGVAGSGAGEPGSDKTAGPSSGASGDVDMPLADVVAGAEFGTLVHEVLERIDPTTDPLEPHLRAAIDLALGRDRLAVDRSRLVEGLAAAIRTPLGWIAGGRSLADIRLHDRLAELDFEMSLRHGDSRFAARDIGEVLLATLPDDDPQRRYGELLADGRFGVDLGGFLRGSIDAVLRVEIEGEMRHLVVDYKTNRLHARGATAPLEAYHPGRLPGAMAVSDYVLQGLLYSVAVHRFLRRRLAGYDPAVHLGGIGYLYVRGMVGPATPVVDGVPYGVFAWRPPATTILALDTLFAAGAHS